MMYGSTQSNVFLVPDFAWKKTKKPEYKVAPIFIGQNN